MQTIFQHRGYDMRSHSETRWASIMDVLRINWLYEPRMIRTRHGMYLPDFYLPSCGVFIEVKGPTPSDVEIEKAADVEIATGLPVIFAHGDPVIIHDELFHGVLTYYWKGGSMSYSTAEIGQLVRSNYDVCTYHEYLRAGAKKKKPDVVHVSEIVSEWLTAQMSRGDTEKSKREKHHPLNEDKKDAHKQSSLAEWFVSEFARVIDSHNKKEAA